MTSQLIRSRTSVGANTGEAFYAHSRAGLIAKIQVALKECAESEYCLELLMEAGYYENVQILKKCIGGKMLLVASRNTEIILFAYKTRISKYPFYIFLQF